MKRTLFVIALFMIAASAARAQSQATIVDPDPELERKTFILPEGFEVNLFAADPLLAKPIQMNFDPQGRLWLACSEVYPHIKPGEKANDKILVLEDTQGQGKADKVTVFAEGLLIPTGIEPGDGGAYVGNSTELLHLSASKPGGKADRTRVVLSGFGTEDTHHIVHALRWGPDGALYFNQSVYIHSHLETPRGVRHLNGGGIWRFRPETQDLDVFVRGFWNPWGHHIDRFGQSFITDGANGEGITHGLPGAGYPASVGMPRILHGMNPGSPKHCGLEILSGTHLPEDWRENIITCDFRGHRVCRFVIKEDGSSFTSQEKPELIKSNHPAFRPIDIKVGPDGAIYIADWYNPIIQHGEIDFRDPRRDHTHGRIWRITAKNRPLVQKPDLVNASPLALFEQLRSPEDWVRHQAKRVLKERGGKEVEPALREWLAKLDARDPTYGRALLEALWVCQSLDIVEPKLLAQVLHAPDYRARSAAVRVLSQWQTRVPGALDLLSTLVHDEHPRVRLEAVRALGSRKEPAAVEIALQAVDHPMDRFLEYAIWLTVTDLEPYWLPAFREGKIDFGGNVARLSAALQASGSNETVKPLVALLQSGKLPKDREEAIWLLLIRIGGSEELAAILNKIGNQNTNDLTATHFAMAVEEAVAQRRLGPPPHADEALKSLTQHRSHEVRRSALRLIGRWKLESLRPLTIAVADGTAKDADALDRRAALEALVLLGGKSSEALIERLASPEQGPDMRRAAVMAFAGINLNRSAQLAAELLASAKPADDLLEIYTSFLQYKGGSNALAQALAEKKLPTEVAKLGVRAVRGSVQDAPALLEALTRAGDLAAQKREITKAELDGLVAEVAKSGDAARGEALYRRADLQCMNCHSIGGAGGQVGPDLGSIGGSAPVDYLIESLLVPNKAVKEGYHAVRIETADGRTVSGIKVRETKTEFVIRTAEDRELTIPVKDIEEKRDSRSLMPDGLVDTLTRGEMVDLVRFLSELGKIGPYSLSKARVVRRWQVLDPTPTAIGLIRKTRIAAAAEPDPAFVWNPAYSTVAGDLPLPASASFRVWQDVAPLALVRCQLDVTAAGKAKLHFNSAVGLSLFVNSNPVDVAEEVVIDLPVGVQTLLFAVDVSRRKEPLHVELEDVPNSNARVSVIGGK